MNEKNFSSLLEELRTARNISKTELAKRTGLTPGYISHLTLGERETPSEKAVQSLADALELEADTRNEFFEIAGYSHLVTTSFLPSSFRNGAINQSTFPSTSTPVNTHVKVNWDDIPHIENFYGREEDQSTLTQWIGTENCRVVAIVGIGGIGKTSLAAQLVEKMYRQFAYVYWCSLRDAPSIENTLVDCIRFISESKLLNLPEEKENRLPYLLENLTQCLNEERCLLILDNFESVLQVEEPSGRYLPGYEGYGRLINSIGEVNHKSSLLLTSREKPREVVLLEGKTSLVRSMSLPGLEEMEVRKLIVDKGLSGTDDAWHHLIELYSGNPLALKLAAEPINQLFEGNIDAFLAQEQAVVGDISELINTQFRRLSSLEQTIMYWLAIERDAVELKELREYITPRVLDKELMDALTSLRRRSMIDLFGTARFNLQPVIMEYILTLLIEYVCEEIKEQEPVLLKNFALLNAKAKDQVRDSQMRLILLPIVQRLKTSSGEEGRKQSLERLLDALREKDSSEVGEYVIGNLLNLLVQITPNLSGYNFSNQTIQYAFLQGVTLEESNFANATFKNSVFSDTFGKVLSVAISPNGNLLGAGVANNEIRLWKLENLVPFHTLQGHVDWVRAIAFSPDSKLLASASEDRTVRVWEVNTGKCIRVLEGHSSLVYSVTFSSDGELLASCGDDKTILLWNVKSGQCVKTLTGHTNKVWSVAFNRDDRLLVSGSDDKTVRVWEVSSGKCLNVLEGHGSKIWTVAFSPDGELIASGSNDTTIRIWQASTGELVHVLWEHTGLVYSVAFSSDGKTLASGYDDKKVGLWDVRTGKLIRFLDRHLNRVRSVAFTPDGTRLASGSDDQTIRIWDVKSEQCLSILQGYSNEVWKVAFSPDGELLVSGSEDQQIRFWDVSSGELVRTLSGHVNRVRAIAFSPDGTLLATGSDDQTARLWQVSTGEQLIELVDNNNKTWVWTVAFSPDSKLLATAGDDMIVRLWDVTSAILVNTLKGHENWIWSATFSPDGTLLATGSDDGTARLWNVNTGECLFVLKKHTNRVRTVAFSPDGTLLATGSDDQTICLWNVDTATCVGTLGGDQGWVRSVAFSPDRILLATASDEYVHLWDVVTHRLIDELPEYSYRVHSVAFSPDGEYLACGGQNGKTLIWKVKTREIRQELIIKRPYEKMNIVGVKGLTLAQRMALKALGASDQEATNRPSTHRVQ